MTDDVMFRILSPATFLPPSPPYGVSCSRPSGVPGHPPRMQGHCARGPLGAIAGCGRRKTFLQGEGWQPSVWRGNGQALVARGNTNPPTQPLSTFTPTLRPSPTTARTRVCLFRRFAHSQFLDGMVGIRRSDCRLPRPHLPPRRIHTTLLHCSCRVPLGIIYVVCQQT